MTATIRALVRAPDGTPVPIVRVHGNWLRLSDTRPPKPPKPPGPKPRDYAAIVAAVPRPELPTSDPLAGLSPARRAMARLAAEGRSNAEVAAILSVGESTVRQRISEVYRQLGIAGESGTASRQLAWLVGAWDARRATEEDAG